jgi:hypothetical protein
MRTLLERLYREKSTGTLSFSSGRSAGYVSLEQGKATRIVIDELQGQPAVSRVMGIQEGTYRFEHQ